MAAVFWASLRLRAMRLRILLMGTREMPPASYTIGVELCGRVDGLTPGTVPLCGGGGTSGGEGRRRLLHGCRGCGGLLVDAGDDVADLQGLAHLAGLVEHAGNGCWKIGVGFVGFQFEKGFVGLDVVSFILEPAEDGGLADGVAE